MNIKNLYQALEKYVVDFAVILDNTDDSDVRFSWQYKRKRKAMITAYHKTSERPVEFDERYRKIRFGQRIKLAVLAVVTALFMTGAVICVTHYVGNFIVKQYDDHSDGFVLDWENAPRTLEKAYRINYDLSDFDMEVVCDDEYQYWEYYCKNEPSYQYINFSYGTKEGFQNVRLNTENSEIEKIEVNGKDGIYYVTPDDGKCLIWDNGEYIFEFYFNIEYKIGIEIAKSISETTY